jgi:hypothetical protein
MIEEDLDEALGRQARVEQTSKAALIRRYVRQHVPPAASFEHDALWDFVGKSTGRSEDSESVDDVVYPR